MATLLRPAIFRQSALLTFSRRCSARTPFSPSLPIATLPSSRAVASRRLAAVGFHTSSRRSILPPGPQVIEGTTNDAAPVPDPSPTHGSYHWTFERAISVGLIPLTIAPFAYGTLHPALDALFVTSILLHSHIGFTFVLTSTSRTLLLTSSRSMITDYIPKRQHPTMRKTFEWLLMLATIVVGVGFYEFETNDVGFTEGVKRIWRARSAQKKSELL